MPTRSTPATASCPRTPTSRAPCTRAGLVWVGPSPESIEQMGSKVESKKLMEAAGVPVLGNLTVETATEMHLPLLVKASAGGGGRGMRVVRSLADLPGEIAAAAAEAESAFGDGTVFVEPYVEQGRHVEVQVVGHTGGVLVLGERDCSIQRRHQKVVEESPAPGLSEDTRRALHAAAAAAAAAVDYHGRRDGRVPLRPGDGALLLPGDEHPAPGGAPGHRAGPRGRPGGAAAGRGRGRWARSARPSGTPTATRSRSGCTPRTRPPTGSRRAAGWRASRSPGSRASSTCSTAPASGSTPASPPATRCRRTTTPCSPR